MSAAPPFLPISDLPVVALGRCAGGALGLAITAAALSDDSAVSQVTDLNVTGATNSSAYSIRAEGSSAFGRDFTALVEYTSDGSATQTEIRDGLLAAWNAHPIAGGLGSLVAGSNKLTFTASRGGAVYTVTFTFPDNPSTDLTQTAVTSAADAPTYYMGRAVEVSGLGNGSIFADLPATPTGATITYAVTHGAGATYTGVFTALDALGVQRSVSWSASAGAALANTLANIETAIISALSTAGIVGGTASDATSPNVVVSLPLGSAQPLEQVVLVLAVSVRVGIVVHAVTLLHATGSEPPNQALFNEPEENNRWQHSHD